MYRRILFRPEGGDGTGGASGSTPPAGDPPAAPPSSPPAGSFTQEQVNELLSKRLASERKKWEGEAAEAAKTASLNEVEKANAAKTTAEKALADERGSSKRLRAELAATHRLLGAGVRSDRLPHLLRIMDLEGVIDDEGALEEGKFASALEATRKELPEFFAPAGTAAPPAGGSDGKGKTDPPARSGGEHAAGAPGKTWSRTEIAELAKDPKAYAEHEEEIDRALAEGRITA